MSYGKEIITEIAKLYYEEGMTRRRFPPVWGFHGPIGFTPPHGGARIGNRKNLYQQHEVNMTVWNAGFFPPLI